MPNDQNLNCSGSTLEDSLHSGIKCGGYHTPLRHQSSMLNWTLDASGKLDLAQDAEVKSWAELLMPLVTEA